MNCGYRGTSGRVVGGTDAKLGDYPWQVSIVVKHKVGGKWVKNKWKQHCGGSIINQKFILTAAHCFMDTGTSDDPTDYQIRAGFIDFNGKQGPKPTVYNVKKIKVHKGYESDGGYDQHFNNDIALITLEKKIRYTSNIKPICLKEEPTVHPTLKDNCYVTGWGVTKEGALEASRMLQEAKVPIVSNDVCKKPFFDKLWNDVIINENKVCAGYAEGGIDSCQGDSGGPLTCRTEGDAQFFLGGVVSSGYGCAQKGFYGVYTRYTKFIPWIKENIRA